MARRITVLLFLALITVVNLAIADWPVSGNWPERLSSDYGPRAIGWHKGIDFPVALGSTVVAARDGEVKEIGFSDINGFYIKIGTDFYLHLTQNSYYVEKGDYVEAGDAIALSGTSGRSTGPHLHFQIGSGVENPLRIFTYSPGTPSIKSTELKGRVMKLNGKDCVLGEVNFIAYIETIKKDLNYVKFEVSPNPTGSGFPLEYDYEGTKRELDCKSTCDYNIPAQDYFYHSFNPLSSGNPWPEGEYKITVTAIVA